MEGIDGEAPPAWPLLRWKSDTLPMPTSPVHGIWGGDRVGGWEGGWDVGAFGGQGVRGRGKKFFISVKFLRFSSVFLFLTPNGGGVFFFFFFFFPLSSLYRSFRL